VKRRGLPAPWRVAPAASPFSSPTEIGF